MRTVLTSDGDNIPEKEEITEEVAECPVCGAIIPGDAKVCPECGAVFEEEEEETGGVELEEEEEIEEEEYEEEEEGEEEIPEGEVKPVKANKKMFWIGLITLLVGSQGVALGSLLHNTLHIFVSPGNRWQPLSTAAVYGWKDQLAGIVGIIITIIGFVLLIVYMKKQSEEEKYRKQLEEEAENDPEIEIPEEFQEPLLVQNKMFFWIGLILMFITGPMSVIAGFLGGNNVDQLGAYVGGGGGGTLTVLGIILLFLSIWQKKSGEEGETEEETEEEEYEEYEEESEEEYEEGEEEEEFEEELEE